MRKMGIVSAGVHTTVAGSTRPVVSGPITVKVHFAGKVRQVSPGPTSPSTSIPSGHWGTLNFHINARISRVAQCPTSHIAFVTRTVGRDRASVIVEQAVADVRTKPSKTIDRRNILTGSARDVLDSPHHPRLHRIVGLVH